MKTKKLIAATLGIVMMIGVAGCGHKLVASGGQTTVPLYPDEKTFVDVSRNAQEGGVAGMVGNVQKNIVARQIQDQTPVKILASDSNGVKVEITQGPMKGQTGFVAHQNVN